MSEFFEQHDPGIPEPLAARVRALHEPIGALPRDVDEAVLAAARRRPDNPWILRIGAGMAAAAALALAFWLWPSPPSQVVPALSAKDEHFDIDKDGTIDMLDALALARAIEGRRGGDINGDGFGDVRDVDAIAMRAVSLRAQS